VLGQFHIHHRLVVCTKKQHGVLKIGFRRLTKTFFYYLLHICFLLLILFIVLKCFCYMKIYVYVCDIVLCLRYCIYVKDIDVVKCNGQ